jgi:NAD(P)H-dependent FMN reductase
MTVLPALRLLAISGSLHAESVNTQLLRACARLAPSGVRITLYEGLRGLPYFHPALDTDTPPRAVARWRMQVAASHALILSSPEHAGAPGVLKNALDWLVGTSDIVGKPVALLSSASRTTHAQKSLARTLKTISARLILEEPYLAAVAATTPSIEDILGEPVTCALLQTMIDDLICVVRAVESPASSDDTLTRPALVQLRD